MLRTQKTVYFLQAWSFVPCHGAECASGAEQSVTKQLADVRIRLMDGEQHSIPEYPEAYPMHLRVESSRYSTRN